MNPHRPKVYLAGRYDRRDELRAKGNELEKIGYTITARWLSAKEHEMQVLTPIRNSEISAHDLEDIRAADWLVCMSEAGTNEYQRGGRHVEWGYALALDKKCILIGGEENVFHWQHGVEHFKDWAAFIANLPVKVMAKKPTFDEITQDRFGS